MNVTADNVIEAVNNDQSFVNLTGASVGYSTSDPTVATVSSAGLVHAVGDGTATISVTVNGVTGTAPIVVRHTLSLAAPQLITAGGSGTATTTFVTAAPRPRATWQSRWACPPAGARRPRRLRRSAASPGGSRCGRRGR